MKSIYNFTVRFVLLFLMTAVNGQTATVVRWDFNGSTGTAEPAIGSGTAMLIGTSATFKSGSTTDPVGATAASNFAWNTSSYAQTGAGNKQNGIQFNLSTIGFRGIKFKFDQRLSPTANNTYLVQYTLDRTAANPVWADAVMFTFAPAATGTADIWYSGRLVDLSTVLGLDNNPNVAIRIVSAFDPATSNYLAAASNTTYSSAGTVRFDMVTISGIQTLGVEDYVYAKPSFSFYPNPTKGNFIYFNQYTSVRIFDITGKTVMSAKDVKELNLENLPSGLYFVENEDKKVIKMVKN